MNAALHDYIGTEETHRFAPFYPDPYHRLKEHPHMDCDAFSTTTESLHVDEDI